MSQFLTCQEYENLAASLKYPTKAFIDGKFIPAGNYDNKVRYILREAG